MALRQYSLGDDSQLVIVLLHHLVSSQRSRIVSDCHVFEDHNPGKLDPVNIYDAYRPISDERAQKARHSINNNALLFPEDAMCWGLQVDKVIVIYDKTVSAGDEKKRTRKRVAIIVLRKRDFVFDSLDVVTRYRVTLVENFATNNNRWTDEPTIELLGDHDPIEVETQNALAEA